MVPFAELVAVVVVVESFQPLKTDPLWTVDLRCWPAMDIDYPTHCTCDDLRNSPDNIHSVGHCCFRQHQRNHIDVSNTRSLAGQTNVDCDHAHSHLKPLDSGHRNALAISNGVLLNGANADADDVRHNSDNSIDSNFDDCYSDKHVQSDTN